MKMKLSTIVVGAVGLGGLIYLVRLARAETMPPKKYKCTGAPNYQCVEDPNGPYNSLVVCEAACVSPVLTSILASPSSSTISPGGSQVFIATAKSNGNVMSGITINWSLSDSTKATISPTSGVTNSLGQTSTTLTAGNTAITDLILSAKSGAITGTAPITISAVTPILTTISLDSPSTINEGTQKQLTATCLDQGGNVMDCPTITWTSSNINIAEVNQNGLVTAKLVSATSNVTITAKHTRADEVVITGTSVITVSDVPPVLDSIAIQTPLSVTVGGTTDVTANCKDKSGNIMTCPGTLGWNIVDGDLFIDIAPTGLNTATITGVATGTAHITAYYG